jgi:hypothetical protein
MGTEQIIIVGLILLGGAVFLFLFRVQSQINEMSLINVLKKEGRSELRGRSEIPFQNCRGPRMARISPAAFVCTKKGSNPFTGAVAG